MTTNAETEIERINKIAGQAHRNCRKLNAFQREQAAALVEYGKGQSGLFGFISRTAANMARLGDKNK